MRRGASALVLAPILSVLAASQPASAADPEVLAFVNDGVLSLTLAAGSTEAAFTVDVVNGDAAPRMVTLRLVDTTLNGAAALIPGAPEPLGSANVPAGETHAFDVTFESDSPYAGKFTGRLVAVDSAGHIARREFVMSVAAAPTATPPAGELTAPLPGELVLTATKRCPTPLHGLCERPDELLGLPRAPVAPELATLIGSVPLSGANAVAQLSVEDGRLTVNGVTGAGEYKGKITIGTGDAKQETTVRLIVTDIIILPLIVLIAGLWCATRVEDFFKYRRPLAQLRIALESEKGQALHAQQTFSVWLTGPPQPEWPPQARTATAIYAIGSPSLLGDEIDRAVREFKQIESADERDKRWGLVGTERARIGKLVDRLQVLDEVGRAMSAAYNRLIVRVGKEAAAAAPGVKAAGEAWAGGVVPPGADFEGREKEMTAAAALLEKLLAGIILADEIAQVAEDLDASDLHKKKIAALKEQLLSLTTDSADVVDARIKELRGLETEVRAAAIEARADMTDYASPQIEKSSIGPLEAELESLAGVPLDRELSVELARQERWYNVAAAIFVILSGLSVLYFGKASFGTVGDYLGVFLWGVGVGEVVKLLPRLPLLRTT